MQEPNVIVLLGMPGAGKSSCVDHLTSKGFPKSYFGGITIDEVKRRGMEVNPANEKIVREDIRAKEGILYAYERFLVKTYGLGPLNDGRLDGMRIAIDTANGAASGIAQRVFTRLGAFVIPLFDHPDGRNINVNCGATDVSALQDVVMDKQLDMGIAFDGDADRVMLVDSTGKVLDGDNIMYINAFVSRFRGRVPAVRKVVATIMSNMGLEIALAKHDIVLLRTDVGDRYVEEALVANHLHLGGEKSGHIRFQKLSPSGDGPFTALKTARAVRESDTTLERWREEVPFLPQALVNVPVADKASVLNHPGVMQLVENEMAELRGAGRVNVRASGTEPKVRVMVEADDADERAAKIAERIKALIAA